MATTAFRARSLLTPDLIDDGVVVVEDATVIAVGRGEAIELPTQAREVAIDSGHLVPGFIDTHNHGAGGRDVMQAERDALEHVGLTLARFGTAAYYPTTVTAPTDKTMHAVEFLADYIAGGNFAGAEPLGIHMEGPFISKVRRGVHPPEHIVEPTLAAYQAYAHAASGRLSIMTIAPELAAAPELIREMFDTNVKASIGHTDADAGQALAAVDLGARQATHMFNAMRPFGHRDPGVIGAVLTDQRVRAELIADGIHVDPKAMELLYRAKGAEGVVLISDGISAVGMPDGRYDIGLMTVDVADGTCMYEGKLAGSVLTLDRAIRNMVELVGVPLPGAVAMATRNPAEMMGISDRKGSLQPGADADLVWLDDDLTVRQVWRRGVPVA